MGRLGKRLIGIAVGVVLFIVIQEMRSHRGSSGETGETTKVTDKDVNTYLQIMRATAARVKNPLPDDLATVDAFSRIPNVHTAQSSELTEDQKNTIFRAIRLTSQLDDIVAEEQNVASYSNAKEAVESILPAPDEENPPQAGGGLTASEKKALSSGGAKALAPYGEEIRALQIEIYNNPLRKTVKGN